MDYERIYAAFIDDRKAKPVPTGYSERHHIVPRSLGGGDEKSNLIRLTAEDHFFAHLLLAKAHGGKMWFPLKLMLRPAKQLGIVSRGKRARRIAALAKREQSARQLGVKRPDVSAALKGRVFSDETRAAMSRSAMGKTISEETRLRMSKANMGRVFTAERNAKIAASRMGDRNPAKKAEVRKAISDKAKINNAGRGNPRFNPTIYDFIHDDGRKVSSTKFDMALAHSLNRTCLNYVINGVRTKTKGWSLAS